MTSSFLLTGTLRSPCNWWLLPCKGNGPLLALSSCPATAGSPTTMPWCNRLSLRSKSLLDSMSLGSKLEMTWTIAYNSRKMIFVALFPAYIEKIFKTMGTGVMQQHSTKISEIKLNGMDWGYSPFPVTFVCSFAYKTTATKEKYNLNTGQLLS